MTKQTAAKTGSVVGGSAPANRMAAKTCGQNWHPHKIDNLPDVIENIIPLGGNQWDK
ncbi:hypothetical protein HK100_009842, partial [Physocladia obscura]